MSSLPHLPAPDAPSRRHADRRIMALADSQHGVVTRRQLLREGLTDDVVDGRVRCGLLQQVYRGVYRVGPAGVPKAREMAAVLVCGENAIVSGRSAAVLWRMLRSFGVDDPIEVTIAGRRPVARPGIAVRHVRRFLPTRSHSSMGSRSPHRRGRCWTLRVEDGQGTSRVRWRRHC